MLSMVMPLLKPFAVFPAVRAETLFTGRAEEQDLPIALLRSLTDKLHPDKQFRDTDRVLFRQLNLLRICTANCFRMTPDLNQRLHP